MRVSPKLHSLHVLALSLTTAPAAAGGAARVAQEGAGEGALTEKQMTAKLPPPPAARASAQAPRPPPPHSSRGRARRTQARNAKLPLVASQT